METPRKFNIAKLSIHRLGSSSVVLRISSLDSADKDSSLRIESFAMINLRGVSTKLYFNVDGARESLHRRIYFLFLASILKHMAHCFNLTHQMEYLLATGTLRSKSGLGLMQVYRFHNHEII